MGVVSDVLLFHELKLWVLYQLTETDHQAPRVWTACLEPLKEDLTDLLKNYFSTCLSINRKDGAREVEGVSAWVPELIHDSIKEAQTSLII